MGVCLSLSLKFRTPFHGWTSSDERRTVTSLGSTDAPPLSDQELQVALLLQRDRARHLSVEILQLQNISLENPIVWHYLRDSTFSRFDTKPDCDKTHTHTQSACRRTDTTTMAYTALTIASRGKNRPYCTAHQL